MGQERTGERREERKDLDSFRQTNLPSSQPEPSHCPASQRPTGEVRPRRMRPLAQTVSVWAATARRFKRWYLCRAIPQRSVEALGLRLGVDLSLLSIWERDRKGVTISGSEEGRLDSDGCDVRYGSVDYRLPPCSALSSQSDELSEASWSKNPSPKNPGSTVQRPKGQRQKPTSRFLINLLTLAFINLQQKRRKVRSAALLTGLQ